VNTITNINNIESLTSQYINKIAAQIASDVNTLIQAQIDIVQQSVAQSLTDLIGDECAGQIMSAVMSQPLRNEVTKVKDRIVNQRLLAIKGYV
jgi:hypothetical protein